MRGCELTFLLPSGGETYPLHILSAFFACLHVGNCNECVHNSQSTHNGYSVSIFIIFPHLRTRTYASIIMTVIWLAGILGIQLAKVFPLFTLCLKWQVMAEERNGERDRQKEGAQKEHVDNLITAQFHVVKMGIRI